MADCERVVAETIARLGRVDILVNAAAILARTPLEDADADSFARVFDTNCRSVFFLCREVIADMEPRGWGRIVNVTSVGVHVGGYSITSALYEATKGAVEVFTKTFARYAAPKGILVNAVAPGAMRTPMITDETPVDVLDAFVATIPAGRHRGTGRGGTRGGVSDQRRCLVRRRRDFRRQRRTGDAMSESEARRSGSATRLPSRCSASAASAAT